MRQRPRARGHFYAAVLFTMGSLPIGNMTGVMVCRLASTQKERTMGRLTVETAGRADARTGEFVEAFARRVEAMPPGQCPVGLVLGQLQASAAQTCGKCTPCAQGMPKLEALLREVAQFRATAATLDEVRVAATLLRDTADCAVGWQAGAMVLAGARRLRRRICQPRGSGHVRPRHAPNSALRHAVSGPRERAGPTSRWPRRGVSPRR